MDYSKIKEKIKNCSRTEKTTEKVQIAPVRDEYITLKEGAERYCMCYKTFRILAYEAHAIYKRNRKCIVNVRLFEEYFETFRE